MNAPVAAPKEWSRGNEVAFRNYMEGELADTYRKSSDVIIPYGFRLGFVGATGNEVAFALDASGAFAISVDGETAITFATSGDLSALNLSLTALVEEVDDKLTGSVALTLDINGRISQLKLLSDGSLSSVIFTADSFQFYDGVTTGPLFSASAGVVTINGDLAVSGSIRIGAVRWPVSLQPKTILKADGESLQWANGAALSAIPNYTIQVPGGVALAAGEAWEPPTLQSVTTTGAVLRLKISTPGLTSSVTDTTDSAGGGGDPDRVMDKADSADAYDGVYNFRVQGTINIVSYFEGFGVYFHTGSVELSIWFDDGGGWDEGPAFVISVIDALGYDSSGSDMTGAQSFDITRAITWSNAIGQHGGKEYGVSHESGGSLTDFVSVQYTKQSTSGTRTGSPNGETATILAIPANA